MTDEVYITPAATRLKSVYHTSKKCPNFPSNPQTKQLAMLNGGWEECSLCKGDPEKPDEYNMDAYNIVRGRDV